MPSAPHGTTLSCKDFMPKKSPIPTSISPMLCQLTRNVTDDPAYVHEVKWDGYRIIAYIEKGKVRMTSRGGNDYTSRYPAIEKALQQLGHDLVIDGEMVVFDEKGMPAFHEMQSSKVTAPGLAYCAFDLLWIGGVNMMDKPLVERKKRLEKLLGKNPIIKYSPHFEDGPGLYAQMEGMGMEGVVSKKRD